MEKLKKAVFPGSFDPLTIGHQEIINRGLKLFNKIVIAVGKNAKKQHYFSLDERLNLIKKHYKNNPNVVVCAYDGLTADFCKSLQIDFLLRGLRNTNDFEFEQNIAQTNKELLGIDTFFLISSPEHSHISSSLVRELLQNGHSGAPYFIQM